MRSDPSALAPSLYGSYESIQTTKERWGRVQSAKVREQWDLPGGEGGKQKHEVLDDGVVERESSSVGSSTIW